MTRPLLHDPREPRRTRHEPTIRHAVRVLLTLASSAIAAAPVYGPNAPPALRPRLYVYDTGLTEQLN